MPPGACNGAAGAVWPTGYCALVEAHAIAPPSEDNPSSNALSEVLTDARAAVDQEFEVTQRLDAKARGLVTVAAQWFGIAQAVSAVAFTTKQPHDWMLWTVGGTAFLGAVALGALFLHSSRVWSIRDEPAVSPKGLLQMQAAARSDPKAIELLIQHNASILRDRRLSNKTRADHLATAQWVWFIAMALPLVQLGFALATRLFS